ncbi:hypothetical protein [Streptomyces sp. NPDC096030]|uniref:hypothetical protein n=1 Tax=Streptomyces sp. NPDC096030 TaxID=3155423 RepID=UPI003318B408
MSAPATLTSPDTPTGTSPSRSFPCGSAAAAHCAIARPGPEPAAVAHHAITSQSGNGRRRRPRALRGPLTSPSLGHNAACAGTSGSDSDRGTDATD